MKVTTRRSFIKGATVAAIAASTTTTAGATPIQQLFAKWKAQLSWIESDAARDITDAELDQANDDLIKTERDMMAIRATCSADVLAKFAAATNYGDYSLSDRGDAPAFWGEVDHFIAGVAS
jgi:hypothetical protein